MPEGDLTSYDESDNSTTAKRKVSSSFGNQVNNLIITLDGWNDYEDNEMYVCIPPEKDERYDLNQLSIFQALPMSIPYSEVGVLDEEFDEKVPKKPEQLSFSLKTPPRVPVIKQTVKGSPLQHFPPKPPSIYTRPLSLPKTSIPPPDTNSPVVIFHDLFRSQKEWQAFAADLAAMLRRRVIAIDLRNHGSSPSTTSVCGLGENLADIKALFKELKLSSAKTTLIGHGVGAWCAMVYALLYPYKVRNIVSVEANPTDNHYLRNEALKLEAALVRIQTPPRGRTVTDLKLKTSDYLKNYITNASIRAFTVENIIVSDVIGKPEKWNMKKTEIVASFNSLSKFPNFLKSSCFEKPALFVASTASKTLTPEDEPNVMKLFPQAKFVRYEKVTRNPHVDLFDDFLDMVYDFLIKDKL